MRVTMKTPTIIILLLAVTLASATSCKNRKQPPAANTPLELYKTHGFGEIEQCLHNGETVYKCAHNAYDAGNEIFDAKGTKIGSCYYSSRQVDPICKELESCKTLWRVEKNIWGRPGVNELGITTDN